MRLLHLLQQLLYWQGYAEFYVRGTDVSNVERTEMYGGTGAVYGGTDEFYGGTGRLYHVWRWLYLHSYLHYFDMEACFLVQVPYQMSSTSLGHDKHRDYPLLFARYLHRAHIRTIDYAMPSTKIGTDLAHLCGVRY